MQLIAYTSETGFDHRPPEGHPERAERLRAVHAAIESAEVERREAPRAERAQIERVHARAHIDRIFAASPQAGETALDSDTWMSPGSLEAALRAAGAGVAGVDAVLEGEADAVFAACRPPGHHAEPDRAMGFCLFNTVAIAAIHALEAHGLSRAAVIDIDVHHGNGTQAAAEVEPRLSFASIHQGWIYPGTGAAQETGTHGNIVNAPMEAGTRGPAWREAIETRLLPAIEAQTPDILLVSAGFDGHAADPLAGLALEEADYAWASERLGAFAREHAQSRLVCVLEGGYDCPALEASAEAFLRALRAA